MPISAAPCASQSGGQRVAEGVPGKAGEQVAAQPLGNGERHRQRQDPHRPARPDQRASAEPQRREDRQAGRQRDHRERQQPAEGLGIDQERMADPIETGQEIAEAEPPARAGRRQHAAEPPRRRPVDQPDQDRKGDERDRPEVDGGSASADERPRRMRSGRAASPRPARSRGRGGQASRPASGFRWRGVGRELADLSLVTASRRRACGCSRLAGADAGRRRRAACRVCRSEAAVDAQLLHAARIGVEDLDLERPGPGTSSPRTGTRPIRVAT